MMQNNTGLVLTSINLEHFDANDLKPAIVSLVFRSKESFREVFSLDYIDKSHTESGASLNSLIYNIKPGNYYLERIVLEGNRPTLLRRKDINGFSEKSEFFEITVHAGKAYYLGDISLERIPASGHNSIRAVIVRISDNYDNTTSAVTLNQINRETVIYKQLLSPVQAIFREKKIRISAVF